MIETYRELVVGGVLVTPVVRYMALAFAFLLLIRPILLFVGISNLFSNPSIAALSLYVCIFGLLIILS